MILDHWDMWSNRNAKTKGSTGARILDHWDMWSNRNLRNEVLSKAAILDHWDMWSNRNMSVKVDLSEFSDPAAAKPGEKVQVLVRELENDKTGMVTLSKKAADELRAVQKDFGAAAEDDVLEMDHKCPGLSPPAGPAPLRRAMGVQPRAALAHGHVHRRIGQTCALNTLQM